MTDVSTSCRRTSGVTPGARLHATTSDSNRRTVTCCHSAPEPVQLTIQAPHNQHSACRAPRPHTSPVTPNSRK